MLFQMVRFKCVHDCLSFSIYTICKFSQFPRHCRVLCSAQCLAQTGGNCCTAEHPDQDCFLVNGVMKATVRYPKNESPVEAAAQTRQEFDEAASEILAGINIPPSSPIKKVRYLALGTFETILIVLSKPPIYADDGINAASSGTGTEPVVRRSIWVAAFIGVGVFSLLSACFIIVRPKKKSDSDSSEGSDTNHERYIPISTVEKLKSFARIGRSFKSSPERAGAFPGSLTKGGSFVAETEVQSSAISYHSVYSADLDEEDPSYIPSAVRMPRMGNPKSQKKYQVLGVAPPPGDDDSPDRRQQVYDDGYLELNSQTSPKVEHRHNVPPHICFDQSFMVPLPPMSSACNTPEQSPAKPYNSKRSSSRGARSRSYSVPDNPSV
jgi:hypothetical protein